MVPLLRAVSHSQADSTWRIDSWPPLGWQAMLVPFLAADPAPMVDPVVPAGVREGPRQEQQLLPQGRRPRCEAVSREKMSCQDPAPHHRAFPSSPECLGLARAASRAGAAAAAAAAPSLCTAVPALLPPCWASSLFQSSHQPQIQLHEAGSDAVTVTQRMNHIEHCPWGCLFLEEGMDCMPISLARLNEGTSSC